MTKEREWIVHPFGPVYDEASRILILGSMASPKSREFGFFYGHPQNIFWPLLAELLQLPTPENSPAGRRQFALAQHIALWDVVASCEISGAEDSSIRNIQANDLRPILQQAPIRAIFTTGKTAHRLYRSHCQPQTGREAIYLPSTSPANRAAQQKPAFREAWQQILAYLK